MTNQILNFGLPAPIDVQVVGRNAQANYRIAEDLSPRIAGVPGAVDVHVRQEVNAPALRMYVDRSKANEAGLTQREVANSMLISLSSSGQIAPTQWLNPATGVSYQIAVQTPPYRIDSFESLQRQPVTSLNGNGTTQLVRNLVSIDRDRTTTIVNHYNVQPVFDVYVNTDRRDLGGVGADVRKAVEQTKLPPATTISVRGQLETMRQSLSGWAWASSSPCCWFIC